MKINKKKPELSSGTEVAALQATENGITSSPGTGAENALPRIKEIEIHSVPTIENRNAVKALLHQLVDRGVVTSSRQLSLHDFYEVGLKTLKIVTDKLTPLSSICDIPADKVEWLLTSPFLTARMEGSEEQRRWVESCVEGETRVIGYRKPETAEELHAAIDKIEVSPSIRITIKDEHGNLI